jgi:restriction endonuclease Mrr
MGVGGTACQHGRVHHHLEFHQQAIDFTGSVERILLVGGSQLAGLVIEHEVGVASRPVRVPKIDSDYFEEQGQLSKAKSVA